LLLKIPRDCKYVVVKRSLGDGKEKLAGDGESPLSGAKADAGQATGEKNEEMDKEPDLSPEAIRKPEETGKVRSDQSKDEREKVDEANSSKVPLIVYQDAAYEIRDVGQAAQNGRGRPRKVKEPAE
jgi:hypothetical protein